MGVLIRVSSGACSSRLRSPRVTFDRIPRFKFAARLRRMFGFQSCKRKSGSCQPSTSSPASQLHQHHHSAIICFIGVINLVSSHSWFQQNHRSHQVESFAARGEESSASTTVRCRPDPELSLEPGPMFFRPRCQLRPHRQTFAESMQRVRGVSSNTSSTSS